MIMNRNNILSLLKDYKTNAENKYGILQLGIFGSAAREQMNENSDIDVCIELKTSDPFIIVHIKQELEEQFHKPVDIIRIREKMNPYLKRRIEKEAMYV